ncbi:MAG TPA: hypothetical protein VGT78_11985 [Rhizomicrobium sp.]|nr:hypothetical protein [Rhizomicrobium sp.]
MNMRILIAAALICSAMPACAGEIRYPKSGNPAVTAEIPDAWRTELRDDGYLHISSIDRTLEVLFSIVPFTGTLDEAALAATKANHATTPGRGDAVTISGREGYYYYSLMADDSGKVLNLKMIVVQLDAGNVGIFVLISPDKANALLMRASQAVLDSIRLAQ